MEAPDKCKMVVPAECCEGECQSKVTRKTKIEKYLSRKEDRRQLRKVRKQRKRACRELARESGFELLVPPRPPLVKMSESKCHTRVVLDCGYDHLMGFKDICKLAHQISHCYSFNRKLHTPVQLFVTGLNSAFSHPSSADAAKDGAEHQVMISASHQPNAKSTLARLNLVSCENWDLHLKMEDFGDLFPASSIVYLCAESPYELPDSFSSGSYAPNETGDEAPIFSTADVYVIGGLVDHNSQAGFCYRQAMERNYRTARLPIDRVGIELTGRKVLSLVHVFQAFSGVIGGQLDWTTSLTTALPPRKLPASTVTSASHTAPQFATFE